MHPPHDVAAGDAFLYAIWEAVSRSPAWASTLLIITFDEHGGCYDHVLPPLGAVSPDTASNPGDEGFRFDRFGVRVPTILVSPFIEPGTVFRASATDSGTPHDHTSILATIRDWLAIPPDLMLPSRRIAAAPTLARVLTRAEPRSDLPTIPAPGARRATAKPPAALPLNDLQRSLVAAAARRYTQEPAAALQAVGTREAAANFLGSLPSRPGS